MASWFRWRTNEEKKAAPAEEKKGRQLKNKFDPQNPTYSVANDFVSNPSGIIKQTTLVQQVLVLSLAETLYGTSINGDVFTFVFSAPLTDIKLGLLLGVVQSYNSDTTVSTVVSVNIAEVQPLGTNAGTFTSGAFQRRVLNAISDTTADWLFFNSDDYIVTLAPGIYDFILQAPANGVGATQLRIYNNTALAPEDGLVPGNAIPGNGNSYSLLMKRINISTATGNTDYVVEHLCANTVADIGLGAASNIGDNEKYTSLQINLIASHATSQQKLVLAKWKLQMQQAGKSWNKIGEKEGKKAAESWEKVAKPGS